MIIGVCDDDKSWCGYAAKVIGEYAKIPGKMWKYHHFTTAMKS